MEIFPPVMPSKNLEKNNNGIFFVTIASANKAYDTAVPKSEIPKIFFLPYLSESCPKIGVARNCPMGYTAMSKPSKIYPWFRDVPKGNIYSREFGLAKSCGMTGIKIPIPKRSMNTVKNIVIKIFFLRIICSSFLWPKL